jgi:hypothetical protein
MARTTEPQPDLIDIHIPQVSPRDPRIPTGTSLEQARQAAEVDIASRAYDAVQVAAGDTQLPWQDFRDELTVLERTQVMLERIQQLFVGRVLLQRAKEGLLIPRTPEVRSSSAAGAEEELEQTDLEIETVGSQQSTAAAVLAGSQVTADGAAWPGTPIGAGSADPSRARRRETVRTLGIFAVLLLVEGIVVTLNMYEYQGTTWIGAAAIAISALAVLSFGPFLLGRALAEMRARRRVRVFELMAAVLLAAFWIAVGVSLALVRVSVDQAAAVKRLEDRQADQVTAALEAGQPVPQFDAIDPQAIFDPTLPTWFWVATLIGFGVVVLAYEFQSHNPVRTEEAELRSSLFELRVRRMHLVQRLASLKESEAVQEEAIRTTEEYYTEEIDAAVARGAAAKAEYEVVLVDASGDPEMLGAVEARHAAALGIRASNRTRSSMTGTSSESVR